MTAALVGVLDHIAVVLALTLLATFVTVPHLLDHDSARPTAPPARRRARGTEPPRRGGCPDDFAPPWPQPDRRAR